MLLHGRMPAFVLLLALIPLLAGCGIGSWFGFGSEEQPRLPGERIPILEVERGLEPDPDLAGEAVALPAPTSLVDWPVAGGVPSHAPGHLEFSSTPRQVWTARIGRGSSRSAMLTSSPVVSGGRVFALDANARLMAVQASNGRQLWQKRLRPEGESGGFGGGVAVGGERVFASTGFAEAIALDAETGQEVWRRSIPAPSRAAPAVVDDRIYVVTVDNQVLALDAETGQRVWAHSGVPEPAALLGAASPAFARDTVIAPMSSGDLAALQAINGRVVWSDQVVAVRRVGVASDLADIRGLPVVGPNGIVYAASNSGRAVAIDMRSGARVWDRSFGSVETPYLVGDWLFVVTIDDQLAAVRANDGRVRWVKDLPRYADPDRRRGRLMWSGPLLAGGRLIALRSDGQMVAFDPRDGEKIGSFDLPGEVHLPPVLADGTLYVLTERGTLAAYR